MTHIIAAFGGFFFGIFLTAMCYMARDCTPELETYQPKPNPHPPNCPKCGKFMAKTSDWLAEQTGKKFMCLQDGCPSKQDIYPWVSSTHSGKDNVVIKNSTQSTVQPGGWPDPPKCPKCNQLMAEGPDGYICFVCGIKFDGRTYCSTYDLKHQVVKP